MGSLDETANVVQQAAEVHSELQFCILSFCLACIAGIVRTHRDHKFRDFGNLVSIGLVCGFISLGSISLFIGLGGGSTGYKYFLVGVSVFIGLLGKNADKIIPMATELILAKISIAIKEPSQKKKKDD